MKRNIKLLLLTLTVLFLMSFAFGCTEDIVNSEDDTVEIVDTWTMSIGFINEKYIENEKMIIELGYVKENNEAFDGNLKLEVTESDLFDALEPLELYLVSYDENHKIISINKEKQVKDLVLDDFDEEPVTQAEEILPMEDLDLSGLTLLDSFDIDIYGDEEFETVAMYTDAEKDPEGNIMWDDGQNWKIVVEGQDKSFVLFDQYLQLSSLEYFVYQVEDDFHISIINSGTANLTLTDYRYIQDKEVFEKVVKSDTEGNVNMIYKSISEF